MRRVCTVLLLVFLATSLNAFGGGDGGGDGGCCSVPKALEDDAKSLRQDFAKLSFRELQDQQLLGTLCANNACGRLTEEQASKLLDRAIAYAQAETAARDRREAKLLTYAGVVFTGLGLLLAWLAYRLSKEADRRSVRNEVEIEHLRGTD